MSENTDRKLFVLPSGARLMGSLVFSGEVELFGTVTGDVYCKTLQITERGSVDGDIVAERVVVRGEVVGTIKAAEIVLKTACSVEGQIFHQHLVLEDGCYFEGKSRRAVFGVQPNLQNVLGQL